MFAHLFPDRYFLKNIEGFFFKNFLIDYFTLVKHKQALQVDKTFW